MAEARLQTELADTKAELKRLRESLHRGAPTVHKDLSLVSLVPKWSGTDTSISLDEFINSIKASARVGNWDDTDKIQVAVLKLTDSARQFYNGCLELHKVDVMWAKFKKCFQVPFSRYPHGPVPLYEITHGKTWEE
jgi:hypothetical protein